MKGSGVGTLLPAGRYRFPECLPPPKVYRAQSPSPLGLETETLCGSARRSILSEERRGGGTGQQTMIWASDSLTAMLRGLSSGSSCNSFERRPRRTLWAR